MTADGAARVAFRTLGCKVNQVETETFAADLMARGLRLAEPDVADVVVVNTCCVTGDAEKKVRKAVRRALASPSEPMVVVTGCLATVSPEGLGATGSRLLVEPDKDLVASRVAELLGIGDGAVEAGPRAGTGFRTRAMVKVEDGCDSGCAYCIVPAARGNPRSTPFADVLAEVYGLVDAGSPEVVLTGVNLGMYDDGGRDLADLVRAVGASGVPRLRLSSIEPQHLTERLLDALATTAVVCPHLHIPLQSGSDRVLGAMGRDYTGADYITAIERATELMPGLAVTTDVMAGFPGESEDDVYDTMEVCQRLRGTMSKLHVFRYSMRPATRAASMAGQISPAMRESRAQELRRMGDLLRAEYMHGRVGQRAEVLVERVIGGVGEGTTGDYLKVRLQRDGLAGGAIETAVLTGVDGPRMTAA